MSIYQFYEYLFKITELERMLRGDKKKPKPVSTEDLMNEAKKKGIKIPSKGGK